MNRFMQTIVITGLSTLALSASASSVVTGRSSTLPLDESPATIVQSQNAMVTNILTNFSTATVKVYWGGYATPDVLGPKSRDVIENGEQDVRYLIEDQNNNVIPGGDVILKYRECLSVKNDPVSGGVEVAVTPNCWPAATN